MQFDYFDPYQGWPAPTEESIWEIWSVAPEEGRQQQAHQHLHTHYQQLRDQLERAHHQAQQQNAQHPGGAQQHLHQFHAQAQQALHAHHQQAQQHLHAQQQQQNPRDLSDDDIQRELNHRLDHTPITAEANVEAQVKNKEVNLVGTAPNRHVKRIAEGLAWGTPGVINVNNNIELHRRPTTGGGPVSTEKKDRLHPVGGV